MVRYGDYMLEESRKSEEAYLEKCRKRREEQEKRWDREQKRKELEALKIEQAQKENF